jgi:hypothetical protein
MSPSERRNGLLGLMRGDVQAQGMVVVTAGALRALAPLLVTLHEERPVKAPRQVRGRNLFIIEPVGE